MNYFELKVDELGSFVNSSHFREMGEIPISSPRAISQSLNPNASPDDIALIYAMNEHDQLVGYIGILPAKIYTPLPGKVYFNTCWWAHPSLGRGVGMNLFYKMLQITGGKMVFFELTRQTESILRSLSGISFPPAIYGFQGFTRINLTAWIKGSLRFPGVLTPILIMADWMFNLPVRLYYNAFHSYLTNSLQINCEKIDFPGNDLWIWAQNITAAGVKFRSREELQWIRQNPWIIKHDKDKYGEGGRYAFSICAKEWKQFWLKVTCAGNPIGLFYITRRDGLLRVPYAWFASADYRLIGRALQKFMLEEKAISLVFFNPALVNAMQAAGGFFLFRRKRRKVIAWPEEMDEIMKNGYVIQDGDGDAVFT